MRISDWSSDVCSSDLDRLALVEPLAPDPGQRLAGLGLVEREEARHPAIGEVQMVERVEKPWPCQVREPEDGERALMPLAQHRLDAAAERRVDQDGVEIERYLGDGDRMAPRGKIGRAHV